jgi:hypothetical protein
VLIFFNKLEITPKVFESIRNIKPQKLYLISDEGRDENEKQKVKDLRAKIEESIDWDVDVVKIYASENLGLRKRIVSGLNEVFAHEEMAIILEDDCLPLPSFFWFCREMLLKYKNDDRVSVISGDNQLPRSKYRLKTSYTFSSGPLCWGWATWKRFWSTYDEKLTDWPEVKQAKTIEKNYMGPFGYSVQGLDELYNMKGNVDYWTDAWKYAMWKQGGLCIIPKYNLVKNLGWGIEEAVHTRAKLPLRLKRLQNSSKNMYPPYKHPSGVSQDTHYEILLIKTNVYASPVIDALFSVKKRIYKLLGLRI